MSMASKVSETLAATILIPQKKVPNGTIFLISQLAPLGHFPFPQLPAGPSSGDHQVHKPLALHPTPHEKRTEKAI